MVELLQIAHDDFHIRVVRNVLEGIARSDNPSLFTQIRKIAQGFHGFHRDDDIGGALCDEVAGNRFAADAQIRLHVAATLTHAVHLSLLDIKILIHGCFANDGSDGEDALSSHATKDDISFHFFSSCALFCLR